MPDHGFKEILFNVAAETIGALAMMFPVSEEESKDAPSSRKITVYVEFTGPSKGILSVSASAGILPILAGNMLGQNEGLPSAEQQEDALKELANVICGNLLPSIGGSKAVFHIGVPRVLNGHLPEGEKCAPAVRQTAKLWLEAGAIDLALLLEQTAALQESAQ